MASVNGNLDPMDRLRGVATGLLFAIVILLLLASLTGCKTRKLVEKDKSVDSVTALTDVLDSIAVSDSLRAALSHSTKDSTSVYTSHTSDRNRETKDSVDVRIVTVYDTLTRVLTNTVYTDRWHTDYLTDYRTDTFYRERIVLDSTSAYEWYRQSVEQLHKECDSLMSVSERDVAQTVTVEVNKLKWWQKTLMYIGLAVTLAGLAYGAFEVVKNKATIAKVIKCIIP